MRHVEGIIGLCLWHCMIAEALKKCPLTVKTWNTASMALQCQPPNYYHCIRDENGQITQQCLQRVWIQPDMCPEFNAEAQRIDVYPCKSDEDNCPTATFWSNAIYVYPGCFFKASSTTSGPAITFPDTSTEAQDSDDTTVLVVPVIIVCVLVILAVIAGVVCWRRQHRTDLPGEETGNRLERDIDTQQNETDNMLDYSRKNEGEDNSMNLDQQLEVQCSRLKTMYTDIRICLFLHTSVSEPNIEKASGLMGEKIVKENDFKMWTTNKSKSMYVFRHWVDADKEHCVDEVKRTLIKVLQAVIERGTKFVIILPLSIWRKDPILQQLRDLPCCKIRH